ncbi:hypothetical protein JX265_011640 [Neoarthrinium moseri]|uniref:Lipase B n=1 Tax=Neoarthrinium moseri TaxID=1658444 RepID=A0A9P9WBY8_9PEZI|nr:uncharacterized protein JN550_011909 [Neoarthrinium moseri]KAI1856393.1 hypothetical protein JX265_011640 [Neoarthrinium moseri]KAI1859601.1 hypothetical protein JN550_011909 [Neoarthrinium moseri]
MDKMKPTLAKAAPPSVEHAFRLLSSIYETAAHSLFDVAGRLVSAGLSSLHLDNIHEFLAGMKAGESSDSNINEREPPKPIYPEVATGDAPYSFSEAKLRGAIHIPKEFRYGADGAPQPVLLVGGTGNSGYVTYAGSFIPLLQNPETAFADPVWLNIPGYSLDNIQTNAEFVAYAIHYLSSICSRRISVFGYSQGNLDAQWAYKYWPSVRQHVANHVAFSPGYHGTKITNLLAMVPQPPAWLQSTYNSELVKTMRSNGGDSAYVPTTIIYSSTDQVVQPQVGDGASSPLKDEHGAGVSNVMVQQVCPGKRAGGFYTHEGIMLHPLAYALAKDAVLNGGPGQVSRLDLEDIWNNYLAPTLTLEHFVLTENSAVFAAAVTLLYHGKSWSEPKIQSYAT